MCYDTYNRCFFYQWAGSATNRENGTPAKWARRLEAKVPGIYILVVSSESCLAVQWTYYGVTCLFCFWAVYRVTWQVMLGCDMHMNLVVFGQVMSGCNKYSVKLHVLNEYDVLKWSQTKSNNKNEKMGWI